MDNSRRDKTFYAIFLGPDFLGDVLDSDYDNSDKALDRVLGLSLDLERDLKLGLKQKSSEVDSLEVNNLEIDFGGFNKSFLIDFMGEMLKNEFSINSFLINDDGDILSRSETFGDIGRSQQFRL